MGTHITTTGSITGMLLEGLCCMKGPERELDQCRLQRGEPHTKHTEREGEGERIDWTPVIFPVLLSNTDVPTFSDVVRSQTHTHTTAQSFQRPIEVRQGKKAEEDKEWRSRTVA